MDGFALIFRNNDKCCLALFFCCRFAHLNRNPSLCDDHTASLHVASHTSFDPPFQELQPRPQHPLALGTALLSGRCTRSVADRFLSTPKYMFDWINEAPPLRYELPCLGARLRSSFHIVFRVKPHSARLGILCGQLGGGCHTVPGLNTNC